MHKKSCDASVSEETVIRAEVTELIHNQSARWDLDNFCEKVWSNEGAARVQRGTVKSKALSILRQLMCKETDSLKRDRIDMLQAQLHAETKENKDGHRENLMKGQEAKGAKKMYNVKNMSGGVHLPNWGTLSNNTFNIAPALSPHRKRVAFPNRDSGEDFSKPAATVLLAQPGRQEVGKGLGGNSKLPLQFPQNLDETSLVPLPMKHPSSSPTMAPSAGSGGRRESAGEFEPLLVYPGEDVASSRPDTTPPNIDRGLTSISVARSVSFNSLAHRGVAKRLLAPTMDTLQELSEAGWQIFVGDDGRLVAERPKKRRLQSIAAEATSEAEAGGKDACKSVSSIFLLRHETKEKARETKDGVPPQAPALKGMRGLHIEYDCIRTERKGLIEKRDEIRTNDPRTRKISAEKRRNRLSGQKGRKGRREVGAYNGDCNGTTNREMGSKKRRETTGADKLVVGTLPTGQQHSCADSTCQLY